MNIQSQVIILSAELSSKSKEYNDFTTELLHDALIGLNLQFERSVGRYTSIDGQTSSEASFVVVVNNMAAFEAVKLLAFSTFKQESILHTDSNNMARLIYREETRPSLLLGKLKMVNESQAKRMEAYTEMKGEYYAVV